MTRLEAIRLLLALHRSIPDDAKATTKVIYEKPDPVKLTMAGHDPITNCTATDLVPKSPACGEQAGERR